jgi:hypothetical protein
MSGFLDLEFQVLAILFGPLFVRLIYPPTISFIIWCSAPI